MKQREAFLCAFYSQLKFSLHLFTTLIPCPSPKDTSFVQQFFPAGTLVGWKLSLPNITQHLTKLNENWNEGSKPKPLGICYCLAAFCFTNAHLHLKIRTRATEKAWLEILPLNLPKNDVAIALHLDFVYNNFTLFTTLSLSALSFKTAFHLHAR